MGILLWLPCAANGGEGARERLARLEFNGFVAWGERPSFSLADPVAGRNIWLRLEASEAGIAAVAFDVERRVLTVELDDLRRDIALKEDKVHKLVVAELEAGVDERARSEREERMRNLVGFDMALGHLARKDRARERLLARLARDAGRKEPSAKQ